MKWKVKVEWLNHEVVSMSIVESEDGSDTKMKAIDDFAVDWLNCSGLWKPQPDPKNEWFEQAKAKGELFYKELPNRKCHWEHKSGEGWDKAIKEAKEKYGYGRLEESIDVGRDLPKGEPAILNDFSPLGHSTRSLYEDMGMKPKEEPKPIDYSRFSKTADLKFVNKPTIEERLTEIEGVLTSIGSPKWELRKKVEGLEKGLAQLTDTFYICANNETHNYDDLRKRVGELEKDLYKISHLLGKDDSTDELKISKLDVASQKIDLLLAFLEAVCRNLGNDIKKIK